MFLAKGEAVVRLITADEIEPLIAIERAARIVASTYRGIGGGRVHASRPSLLQVVGSPFRLGAKGATLPDEGFAGVRLTSKAAPRTMLWTLDDGVPVAMLDESRLYRFRTGVSAAVVADHLLAGRRAGRVAIIGAGPIAQEMVRAFQVLIRPDQIRIAARSAASAQQLAAATADGGAVVASPTIADALDGADVVVTITTANEVLVRPEHLGPQTIVLSMGGGLEVAHAVWERAVYRLVDDLDYALGQGDAAAWIAAGTTTRSACEASVTATVGAAFAAGTPAPAGPAIAIVQGTTALDIALAVDVFRRLNDDSSKETTQ